MPWVWGEGSVAWLTSAGIECTGLGRVRAIKSPPSPTTTAHGVLVGWSAARAEHRSRRWKSARELALDRERWAAPMRCERGYTRQLPDLAVSLHSSAPPRAVIAESGGRREDRQRMILEGWRDAIWSGRYAAVRSDCASASVAVWINRLVVVPVNAVAPRVVAGGCLARTQKATCSSAARDFETKPGAAGGHSNASVFAVATTTSEEGWAERSAFTATVQTRAEEIAVLSPAAKFHLRLTALTPAPAPSPVCEPRPMRARAETRASGDGIQLGLVWGGRPPVAYFGRLATLTVRLFPA
jgi:hypothetical protein